MKNFLIVGCGDLGTRIAHLCNDSTTKVFAIRQNTSLLPNFVNKIPLDLGSSLMKLNLPIAFDTVFFTAAPHHYSEKTYKKTYLESLQQLQSILRNSKRFIYASSTGVYGQNNHQKITEETLPKPITASGKILLESEQWIQKTLKDFVIVRLSGLYSKDRNRIYSKLRNGPLADIDFARTSNRIHLQDAARLFVWLSQQSSPDQLYLGSDTKPSSHWEIGQWVAQKHGLDWNIKKPVNFTNKIISSEKLQTQGFSFLYPTYKEGFQE